MKFSGKSSLLIQIVFFSGLAITILVIWAFNPPEFLGEKISTGFQSKSGNSFAVLSDSSNTEIKKTLAGYWQRQVPVSLPDKPFSITDHIELKDNGIFWQVKRLVVYKPDGDSSSCTEIVTGFIDPFKRYDEDTTTILVDALVHGQAFATEKDTCYVPGLDNAVANQRHILFMKSEAFATALKRVGTTLKMDHNEYNLYDTLQNSLATFFPVGSTEIIENVSISQCKRNVSPAYFVKNEISKFLTSVNIKNADTSAIRTIIDRYYSPLIAKEISQHYTTGQLKPLQGKVSVVISVNPDGTIKQVKKKKIQIGNRSFVTQLTEEISSWKFMRQEGSSDLRNVYYTFVF